MALKIGIADESFKYSHGTISTSPKAGRPSYHAIFNRDTINLLTAKRDRAVFQVVIQPEEDATISVGNRPSFSEKDRLFNIRISVEVDSPYLREIEVYPVGMIEDDDKTMKADILLQDEVVFAPKNKLQCIWVEIKIPEDIESMNYQGKVTIHTQKMFENESLEKALAFNMDVRDVVLPAPRDYTFYLDLWQHLSNISRKHEVKLWSNAHFEVLEHYVKSLAELGQKAISIVASEIPWSGQGCFRVENYPSNLFEFNMVKIVKNNTYLYDFSIVERYVNLCFKYGIDREIEIHGLISVWKYEAEGYGKIVGDYPDAIRIRYLDETDNCYKYMRTREEVIAYFKAIEKFFIEMGWIDKVRIIADEPSDKKLYNDVLCLLKIITPNFRYKAAINHADFIKESKDMLDDYVPYLPAVSGEWEQLNAIRSQIQGRLLWYVCCEPLYPNTFLTSPLVETRLIGMLTAFINFDGFLRWNYTAWPERPREQISYNYPLWYAGDTNFVYPSNNGRPLLTLRYKALKRGIEDFELISLLKKKMENSDEILEKVWNCIFKSDITNFYETNARPTNLYSMEHSDYEKAKAILLDALSN